MTPVKPFKLTEQSLAQIAAQVVVEAAPLAQICAEAGIDVPYYRTVVEKNPFYQSLLQDYVKEWGSIKKTEDRIKWKSRIMMELALPTIGVRMMNEHEPLPAVTEAAKLIAKLGGVDSDKSAAATGEKFTITINLGPDEVTTVEAPAITAPVLEAGEATDEREGQPRTIHAQLSPPRSPEAVRAEPERERDEV